MTAATHRRRAVIALVAVMTALAGLAAVEAVDLARTVDSGVLDASSLIGVRPGPARRSS